MGCLGLPNTLALGNFFLGYACVSLEEFAFIVHPGQPNTLHEGQALHAAHVRVSSSAPSWGALISPTDCMVAPTRHLKLRMCKYRAVR